MLRTVYLPSANADTLQVKVESLQAQLAEQQQFAAERVEALLQDRKLRDEVRNATRPRYVWRPRLVGLDRFDLRGLAKGDSATTGFAATCAACDACEAT